MSQDLLNRVDLVCAERTDQIAAMHGARTLTFGQLARWSAVLARTLPDRAPIGLCLERGMASQVSYLAVLAAGCVAVALSPRMPPGRLVTMCLQAGVGRVLADERSLSPAARAALAEVGIVIQEVPEPDLSIAKAPALASSASTGPDDVAYILFTSGSTGMPKGVQIPHRALWAYLTHAVDEAQLGPHARMSANFDLTFDPSLFDLLGSLISGATVVFPTVPEQRSPVRYAARHEITHWFSVPSLISFAVQASMLRPGCLPGLERSAFIGEPLTVAQAAAWAQAAPNSRIVNVYGPTELTVACTSYPVTGDRDTWAQRFPATIPIGTSYPGLETCLIDDGELVDGSGELCVRGVQRLTSYLDPADNHGRFYRVDGKEVLPYLEDREPDCALWYRTGDRVALTPEGYVHLGRIDRQVKVHGYRIELGEIENELQAVEGILEAAAFLTEDRLGNEIVVCYLATDTQNPISPKEASEQLAGRIPDYALPYRIELVSSLPRNERGKTDYAVLSDMFQAGTSERS